MTWPELVKIEPQLLALHKRARELARQGGEDFDPLPAWLNYIKPWMNFLIGSVAGMVELREPIWWNRGLPGPPPRPTAVSFLEYAHPAVAQRFSVDERLKTQDAWDTVYAVIEADLYDEKPLRSVSSGKRFRVLNRDGFRCTYCGRTVECLDRGEHLVVDHILPVAAGGGSDMKNLTTACSSCNSGKRDRVLH